MSVNPTRWMRSRWVLSIAAVALVAVAAWGIRAALEPRVYFVSEVAFGYYRDAKVPAPVIEKLGPLERRYYATRSELLNAMRQRLGDADYQTHQATLEKHVRSVNCGPNTSARKVYRIADSRKHPLYNTFGVEVVIPQASLPPVVTDFQFLPDGQGPLVIGKYGHVAWYGPDWKAKLRFQMPDVWEGGDDQGLLGLALDPEFGKNRFIYLSFVTASGVENVVQRLTLSGDAAQVLASRRDVIRLPKDTRVKYHGIGALAFLPGNVLLIQVGDPTKHAQAWGDQQGKILGVVPNRGAEGGYTTPPRSLWQRAQSYLAFGSEIVFAGGLRMPFTATLWNGLLIVGDVGGTGPNSSEEINVYAAPGPNYGWGVCEDPGLHGDFDPPIIAYLRSDAASVDDPLAPATDARSVVVGTVYDGAAVDRYGGALNRRLLYGDFYLGFVRGAQLDDRGQVVDDVFLMHLPYLTSMAVGPDGYVYGTTAIGNVGFFRLVQRKR